MIVELYLDGGLARRVTREGDVVDQCCHGLRKVRSAKVEALAGATQPQVLGVDRSAAGVR